MRSGVGVGVSIPTSTTSTSVGVMHCMVQYETLEKVT